MIMFKKLFWSTVCTFLLMGENSLSKDDGWWHSVRCRLMFPCDVNISRCDAAHTQEKGFSIDETDNRRDKMTDGMKFPNLYSVLQSPAKEAQEASSNLLKTKKISRWGTGRWRNTAEKLRCSLKVCVRREARGLDNEQTKLVGDILQIVSFSHYVDQAASSLSGMKNRRLKATMRELEAKMVAVVCKMRAASQNSPHDHVVPDDVPLDLRHQKRSHKGHVATYVILQKIEEFFTRLAEGYKRLEVCET